MSDWRSDTKSKGNELDRVIKIGDRLGKIIVQSLEARTDFKTENRGTSWDVPPTLINHSSTHSVVAKSLVSVLLQHFILSERRLFLARASTVGFSTKVRTNGIPF